MQSKTPAEQSEKVLTGTVERERPIDQATKIATTIKQTEIYSGPLPRPQDLAQYDQILPGLAERVVQLTEKEQNHRHEMDKLAIGEAIRSEARDSGERKLGQLAAFIIAIIGLGSAVGLALADKQMTASVIGGGTLAAIVTAFLTRKPLNYSEDNKKDLPQKEKPKKPTTTPKKRRNK